MPNQQVTRRQKKVVDPSPRLPSKPGKTHAGVEVCHECSAVHYHDRWYLKEKIPADVITPDTPLHETICPACKQIKDRNPGGTLTLSGLFLSHHWEEINNLIRHEDQAARGVNPLERIMEIETVHPAHVEVTATNEFLVQRLGRAIHKAYSGDIEYKFGGSDVPVRVCWHRD